MSIFGIAPFGTEDGPFGGFGLITILGVLPVSVNEFIVVFDKAPLADDAEGYNSATNVRNWLLVAVDPTITATDGSTHVPKGEVAPTLEPTLADAFVDEDDDTQIHLRTHVRLEAQVRYNVTALQPIEGADCEAFVGPDTFEFRARIPGPPLVPRFVQEDRFRDWSNDPFPRDPKQPESTWLIDATGDIDLHDEDDGLRKRVFRRLLAARGGFTHLPTYGVGPKIKSMARSGELQSLANDVAEQIRQEPDVEAAGADVTIVSDPGGNSIVQVEVFVSRREQRDSRFVFGLRR